MSTSKSFQVLYLEKEVKVTMTSREMTWPQEGAGRCLQRMSPHPLCSIFLKTTIIEFSVLAKKKKSSGFMSMCVWEMVTLTKISHVRIENLASGFRMLFVVVLFCFSRQLFSV